MSIRRAEAGPPIGVAVVGAGYWGPNLIRNFGASGAFDLLWVCDLDVERARRAVGHNSSVRTTSSLDAVLGDPRVEAVVVATPSATHLPIGLACVESGRHVLMEKPLAASLAEAERLVEAAGRNDVVLMCDHTYCYTPAVQRIRSYLDEGVLGDLEYIDSVRINLGLIQPDIDVIWDLAPHDLSVFDYLLPDANRPVAISAHGADPLGNGRAAIGYLTLPLARGAVAHAHVNWLSPVKIRTMIIAGTKRMLVWDDLNPTMKLSLYDKGVDLAPMADEEVRREHLISYRVGDVVSPAIPVYEALQAVVAEFGSAIREGRSAATDGEAGLRVLRTLEAASASLADGGRLVALEAAIASV